MPGIVDRAGQYIRLHGLRYTLRRATEKFGERVLGSYDRQWRRMQTGEAEMAAQRAHRPEAGLISIVVPVYNTQVRLLEELIASFSAQTYADWEAVLYDGSTDPRTIAALDRLGAAEPRLRVMHAANEGLSGNTNRAIALAGGEWVVLCDHDDLLTPDALWRVAECIVRETPDVIYTDEDKITEDSSRFTDPHFKPGFCLDNLRSSNYICHMTAVRKTLLEAVGGLDPAFDGSQDHDLLLRCAEHTGRIAHVPYVTYHWRTVGSSVSHRHLDKCLDAARRAVEAHCARMGQPCHVQVENGLLRLNYAIQGQPRVSVISTGRPDVGWKDVEYVPWDAEGGLYAGMNRSAARATGEVLLFIAPSVTGLGKDFVKEMLMYAQLEGVGAVTPVLTDNRGHITHAGFVLGGKDGAVCRSRGMSPRAGWHRLTEQSHNVAAVSPACVMIRRDRFLPLDEGFRGPLGMVQWCMRLSEKGLRHVYTPHAAAVCTDRALLACSGQGHEADRRRLMPGGKPLPDPCYSIRLNADKGDFSIRK